jgi:integrase
MPPERDPDIAWTQAGCRPVTEKELDLILAAMWTLYPPAVAERMTAMFVLMAFAALRVSECCQLRVRDVSTGGIVHDTIRLERCIVKGKKEGCSLPLHPRARAEVQRWEEYSGLNCAPPSTWLFSPCISRHGAKPLYRQDDHVDHRTVLKEFKRCCQYAGLPGWDIPRVLGTHSLRKRVATDGYDRTQNIVWIRDFLRHKSVATTERYIGVKSRNMAAVMAVL